MARLLVGCRSARPPLPLRRAASPVPQVVAMHSLSANSAADATALPGAHIVYTVRDVAAGDGSGSGALVALTEPFSYDVLAEFGSEHSGRAIAVRQRSRLERHRHACITRAAAPSGL